MGLVQWTNEGVQAFPSSCGRDLVIWGGSVISHATLARCSLVICQAPNALGPWKLSQGVLPKYL